MLEVIGQLAVGIFLFYGAMLFVIAIISAILE
jgi:hypothetical protein